MEPLLGANDPLAEAAGQGEEGEERPRKVAVQSANPEADPPSTPPVHSVVGGDSGSLFSFFAKFSPERTRLRGKCHAGDDKDDDDDDDDYLPQPSPLVGASADLPGMAPEAGDVKALADAEQQQEGEQHQCLNRQCLFQSSVKVTPVNLCFESMWLHERSVPND